MASIWLPEPEIHEEVLALIRDVIHKETHGALSVRQCLDIMLTKPTNNFQRIAKMAIQNDDNAKAELMQKVTKNDFRAFLRGVLDRESESGNFEDTLEQIRESDPTEYHKTLQGWAKIALPQQKDVNIDVNIEQRVSILARMKEQYGYSAAIEEAEELPQLEEPQATPEPLPISEQPVSQRLASTFDPMFYEQPEDTTPYPQED